MIRSDSVPESEINVIDVSNNDGEALNGGKSAGNTANLVGEIVVENGVKQSVQLLSGRWDVCVHMYIYIYIYIYIVQLLSGRWDVCVRVCVHMYVCVCVCVCVCVWQI